MNPDNHPVQTPIDPRKQASLPKVVTMKAYEVYCFIYGEQKAMVEGGCRGGFSTGEIIAFLYASSFPKPEWRSRVNEAMLGMENL